MCRRHRQPCLLATVRALLPAFILMCKDSEKQDNNKTNGSFCFPPVYGRFPVCDIFSSRRTLVLYLLFVNKISCVLLFIFLCLSMFYRAYGIRFSFVFLINIRCCRFAVPLRNVEISVLSRSVPRCHEFGVPLCVTDIVL